MEVKAIKKAEDAAPANKRGSKHGDLTTALREMVGQMRPGDRLPTQDELMRQFKVSDTTVLRSLGDLRREGRIIRRQGSGTFVTERALPQTIAPAAAAAAATPAVARTQGMVALAAEQSGNLFFSEMLLAVENSLCSHDMAPVLIMDRDRDRRMQRAVDYWKRGDVVGAIHIGSTSLAPFGEMPAILIGETEQDREYCQVSLDNADAGRLVGEYLWNLGHRRLAVVMLQKALHRPLLQGVDHVRVAGLRACWEERGGVWREEAEIVHPLLLQPNDGRAVQAMRSYLEPLFSGAEPAPTAIFATHDEMAAVALCALEAMGLRVPRDVSVVGFNDLGLLAAYFRPSLTTVRIPAPTLGTLAVHQLLDLLNDPSRRPRSIRLPAEIIVRESTAPPPPEKAAARKPVSLSSLAPTASLENAENAA